MKTKVLTMENLIETLRDVLDLPPTNENPKKERLILNAIFDTITQSLQRGESVEIEGFGKFKAQERKAHIVTQFREDGKHKRGPKPHGRRVVPPKKYVYFKPARSWTAMVNIARGFPLSFYERRAVTYWKPKE